MDNAARFNRLTDELLELESSLVQASRSASSVFVVETQKEELKSLWQTVKEEYGIVMDSDEVNKKDDIKKKYKVCLDSYVSAVGALSEAVVGFTTPAQNNSAQNFATGAITSSPAVQPLVEFRTPLPVCDTELFHGDYKSWPWFRELFKSIYINNTQISSAQKLYYLNQKCRGEAQDIVRRCIQSNAGFDAAWNNLKERYENERLLVNSQLKILFSLQTVSNESGSGIKHLQREINSVRSALETYEIDISNWDAIFVYLCSTKLPEITLSLWEQSLEEKTQIPQWDTMNEFLTKRFQTLETVGELRQSSNRFSNSRTSHQFSRPNRLSTFHANVDESSCPLCKAKNHYLKNCPKFLKGNAMSRFDIVKRLKLCLNCFGNNHGVAECGSTFNCSKCHQKHHTLLHRGYGKNPNVIDLETSIEEQPSTSAEAQRKELGNVSAHFVSNSRQVLLGTARICVTNKGISREVRALIDPGSEASFVSKRIQRMLKLTTTSVSAQVSGLNDMVSSRVNSICKLSISSLLDDRFETEVECLILPRLTGDLPSHSLSNAKNYELPKIQLADPRWMETEPVDVLIGGDLYPSILLEGLKRNVLGSLLAQQTVFGWILTGPLTEKSKTPPKIVSLFNEVAIDRQLARFWELEEVPKKKLKSEEEQFCENYYEETTERNSNGRYVVRLPFRMEVEKSGLSRSKEVARTIFLRNENNLLKNPAFKLEYDTVLKEYIYMKHMIPVNGGSETSYYMPHHAVIKPESTSTKLRVVFNASSKPRGGQSLNDLLYPGPTLQADLVNLLLKWRFFRFVVNGDIEKMYRQILVHPLDTPFQRILYRETPQEEVKEYELKTVTFGVTCAPYLAIRTLHQLAQDITDTFPLAADILKGAMYVDDALFGYHDLSTAKRARDELKTALKSAGFVIRKWTSNSSELLEDLEKSDLLSEHFLEFEDTSSAKTLGIRWNAQQDKFYFIANPFEIKDAYTKRQILATIAKLFDPAGWLSPVIVKAKIIMQKIWLEKSGWDDTVSENILSEWKEFLKGYTAINLIKIPRWLNYSPFVKVQFHAFSDASERAYGACIYVRVEVEDKILSNLLCSKSKVAPVKSVSLPRLELCGATLLAEMIDSMDIVQMDLSRLYCWTDSTIVLAWLNKPPCMWKVFVANRVSKIKENLVSVKWQHVDSASNPADLVSRGISAVDLVNNSFWWHGPTWLKESEAFWPKPNNDHKTETELELKIHSHAILSESREDLLARFSSFKRGIRVVSYMKRFIDRSRKKTVPKHDYIDGEEFHITLNMMIRVAQLSAYPEEYEDLKSKKPISSKSSILSLTPLLDEENIIRVGGRFSRSLTLSFEEKHPVILPYNCALSRLIVSNVHHETAHGGNQLMLRVLRSSFWIIRVKNLIRSIVRNCKICVIHKKELQQQLMGALPPERVTLSRPFHCTGIDFCGPFDIKTSVGRGCKISKGYVCVFICFATKAIHLEGTTDLSTHKFLEAFSRFVSRRGCPSQVFSDNGTNFVGASRELRRDFKAMLKSCQESVENGYSQKNVKWSFIPPGAPHMGGLWEAGVKSFKSHFRKVVGESRFTFEEFSTLLYRIEACLNSRPLSAQSNDPNDLTPLTPGHFLIGSPLTSPGEPDVNATKLSLLNRWQKMKAIYQEVCRRWKAEYLTELQKRVKWKKPQKNMQVDDLVVVKEENLPPNEWRLGRVLDVHPGKDGMIRVVTLKTARNTLTRPIHKLVLLPNEEL